jgi:hypothetical protein
MDGMGLLRLVAALGITTTSPYSSMGEFSGNMLMTGDAVLFIIVRVA